MCKLINNISSAIQTSKNLTFSTNRCRLSDLRGVTSCPDTRTSLLFVDTSGSNFFETSQGYENYDESFSNFDEAFIVEHLVRKYILLGVKPNNIGVITPYRAQVKKRGWEF